MLTNTSKTPKKENPTNSPNVPPSSATWAKSVRYLRALRASVIRIMLSSPKMTEDISGAPPRTWAAWHKKLGEWDLPGLVGRRPIGGNKEVGFPNCWLPFLRKAVLPVNFNKRQFFLINKKEAEFYSLYRQGFLQFVSFPMPSISILDNSFLILLYSLSQMREGAWWEYEF